MSEMGGETGTVEIPEAANDNVPAGGDAPVVDQAPVGDTAEVDDAAGADDTTPVPEAANDNLPVAANDNDDVPQAANDNDADDSSVEQGEGDGQASNVPAGDVGPAGDAPVAANDNPNDPASLAAFQQMKSHDKYGMDDWKNETREAGTIVWTGAPNPTDFCVSQAVADGVGDDAREYNGMVQAAPWSDPAKPGGMPTVRGELHAFRLTGETPVAVSTSQASPQWGPGGSEQLYIPNLHSCSEPVPELNRPMTNSDAIFLAVDNDK